MNPELSEVKRLRVRNNLTQNQLAKLSNVSQSLIAKVESSRIDPSYRIVTRIFDVLNGLSEQKEHKAEEVMVKKMVTVSSSNSLSSAVAKMKAHSISQVPVIDKNVAVGLLTESNLLDVLSSGKNANELIVKDVMQEAPPIISRKTPMRIVVDLLKYSPLVLIADNGEFEGVITKSDVLSFKAR